MNLPLKALLQSLLLTLIVMVSCTYAYQLLERYEINKTVNSIKAIRSASDAFYSDTGTLPCTKSGGWGEDPGFIRQRTLSNCWAGEGGCAEGCTDIVNWNGPYLDKWPAGGNLVTGKWKYNWNRSNYSCNGIGGVITLETRNSVSQKSLRIIDAALDDGNLSTGYIFSEKNYLQILKCY